MVRGLTLELSGGGCRHAIVPQLAHSRPLERVVRRHAAAPMTAANVPKQMPLWRRRDTCLCQ